MAKSAQEEIFSRNAGDWVWCLHCERAYQVGEYRESVDGFEYCPHPDCDGDTVADSWNWSNIREKHPEYPEVPEKDVVYPLY